jgi:perosamine synthetase
LSKQLTEAVVAACADVLPARRPIGLHEPELGEAENAAVLECLASGWVSTAGGFVDRFERELEACTASPFAIATINGTSALHTALLVAGVRRDDEVLVPALTFVATANAVSYCGAWPNFVDVDAVTLGVDATRLSDYLERSCVSAADGLRNRATGRRIRALIVMHTFGHPADVDALTPICKAHGLALIEDAAESLGSRSRGRHTGTTGLLGALSFNGNKIVTAGGGGAVLTGDPELAAQARHLTTTARTSDGLAFTHDRVGYNYRLPSLNAALGMAQLGRLPQFLARKRSLAQRYRDAFADVSGIRFYSPPSWAESNHWLNTLFVEDASDGRSRDEILRALNAAGLGARPPWTPMHELSMYRDAPRMELEVTRRIALSAVNLPSGSSLTAH